MKITFKRNAKYRIPGDAAFHIYVNGNKIDNALVWPTDYAYDAAGNKTHAVRWACILDIMDTTKINLDTMKLVDSLSESKRLLVEMYVKKYFEDKQ